MILTRFFSIALAFLSLSSCASLASFPLEEESKDQEGVKNTKIIMVPEVLEFNSSKDQDKYVFLNGKTLEDLSPKLQMQVRIHQCLKKLEAQAIGDEDALKPQDNPQALGSYRTFFEKKPEDQVYTALKSAQIGHFILETSPEFDKHNFIQSHREAARVHLSDADDYLGSVLGNSDNLETRKIVIREQGVKDFSEEASIERLFKGIAPKISFQRKNIHPQSFKIGCGSHEKTHKVGPLFIFGTVTTDGRCGHWAFLNKHPAQTAEQIELFLQKLWNENIRRTKQEKRSISFVASLLNEYSPLKQEFPELTEDSLKKLRIEEIKQKLETAYNRDFWLTTEDLKLAGIGLDRPFVQWNSDWSNNNIPSSDKKGSFIQNMHDTSVIHPLTLKLIEESSPEKPLEFTHISHVPGSHFSPLVEQDNWRQMILAKIMETDQKMFLNKADPSSTTPEQKQQNYDEYYDVYVECRPQSAK